MAVEEQLLSNTDLACGYPNYEWTGQRLTIPNREITKISFRVYKVGSPTGNVYYQIRRIDPDEVIYSQLVGDASTFPAEASWFEKELAVAQTINEEVRLVCFHDDGTTSNYLKMRAQDSDVKASEKVTRWTTDQWDETLDYDLAYIYTYTGEPVGGGESTAAALVAANMI